MAHQPTDAYRKITDKFASQQCVILDGGIATELQRQDVQGFRLSDSSHWGFDAIDYAPQAVVNVHQQYVEAGCDVVTTDTYAVLDAPQRSIGQNFPRAAPAHWMDMCRKAVMLASDAITSVGKREDRAVAFSIGGDIMTHQQLETIRLLLRVFEDTPPDLVILETLSMVNENHTKAAIELLTDFGLPVWVSFRRCRHGVCGIYGQLWGGPEGDYFGRLAQNLERAGVGVLLINCLPVEMVSGTISWLRDFTDIPLGAYPNLGRYLDPQWRFDESVTPENYAEIARDWRAEGAQLLGGCCGVGPDHIHALSTSLMGTKPGAPKDDEQLDSEKKQSSDPADPVHQPTKSIPVEPWRDNRGRDLFPLPLPEITCDQEVFVPTQGSYLLWKHLFTTGAGCDKTCLDVGCGTGILSTQLALNGAEHVTAIDIQKEAVANTLTNAFRNGVAERVHGDVVDLYAFEANRRFDLIVGSLYQMPTDPAGKLSGHRPVDYWGRNLLDHLIRILPSLLEENGRALLMQISLLSQFQTSQLIGEMGMQSRVLDYQLYDFNSVFLENLEQIQRVEESSDSYHFQMGSEHVMVMYLLEVQRKQ